MKEEDEEVKEEEEERGEKVKESLVKFDDTSMQLLSHCIELRP